MNEQDKVKVLALLEAYRLYVDKNQKTERNPDHCIRVCSAIIAHLFGYTSRADWTDAIVAAGLIDYRDNAADPYERYKALTALADNIRVEEVQTS